MADLPNTNFPLMMSILSDQKQYKHYIKQFKIYKLNYINYLQAGDTTNAEATLSELNDINQNLIRLINNIKTGLETGVEKGRLNQRQITEFKDEVNRIFLIAKKQNEYILKQNQELKNLDGEIETTNLTLYSNKLQYTFIFFISILIFMITFRAYLFKSGTLVENIMFVIIIGFALYSLLAYFF